MLEAVAAVASKAGGKITPELLEQVKDVAGKMKQEGGGGAAAAGGVGDGSAVGTAQGAKGGAKGPASIAGYQDAASITPEPDNSAVKAPKKPEDPLVRQVPTAAQSLEKIGTAAVNQGADRATVQKLTQDVQPIARKADIANTQARALKRQEKIAGAMDRMRGQLDLSGRAEARADFDARARGDVEGIEANAEKIQEYDTDGDGTLNKKEIKAAGNKAAQDIAQSLENERRLRVGAPFGSKAGQIFNPRGVDRKAQNARFAVAMADQDRLTQKEALGEKLRTQLETDKQVVGLLKTPGMIEWITQNPESVPPALREAYEKWGSTPGLQEEGEAQIEEQYHNALNEANKPLEEEDGPGNLTPFERGFTSSLGIDSPEAAVFEAAKYQASTDAGELPTLKSAVAYYSTTDTDEERAAALGSVKTIMADAGARLGINFLDHGMTKLAEAQREEGVEWGTAIMDRKYGDEAIALYASMINPNYGPQMAQLAILNDGISNLQFSTEMQNQLATASSLGMGGNSLMTRTLEAGRASRPGGAGTGSGSSTMKTPDFTTMNDSAEWASSQRTKDNANTALGRRLHLNLVQASEFFASVEKYPEIMENGYMKTDMDATLRERINGAFRNTGPMNKLVGETMETMRASLPPDTKIEEEVLRQRAVDRIYGQLSGEYNRIKRTGNLSMGNWSLAGDDGLYQGLPGAKGDGGKLGMDMYMTAIRSGQEEYEAYPLYAGDGRQIPGLSGMPDINFSAYDKFRRTYYENQEGGGGKVSDMLANAAEQMQATFSSAWSGNRVSVYGTPESVKDEQGNTRTYNTQSTALAGWNMQARNIGRIVGSAKDEFNATGVILDRAGNTDDGQTQLLEGTFEFSSQDQEWWATRLTQLQEAGTFSVPNNNIAAYADWLAKVSAEAIASDPDPEKRRAKFIQEVNDRYFAETRILSVSRSSEILSRHYEVMSGAVNVSSGITGITPVERAEMARTNYAAVIQQNISRLREIRDNAALMHQRTPNASRAQYTIDLINSQILALENGLAQFNGNYVQNQ